MNYNSYNCKKRSNEPDYPLIQHLKNHLIRNHVQTARQTQVLCTQVTKNKSWLSIKILLPRKETIQVTQCLSGQAPCLTMRCQSIQFAHRRWRVNSRRKLRSSLLQCHLTISLCISRYTQSSQVSYYRRLRALKARGRLDSPKSLKLRSGMEESWPILDQANLRSRNISLDQATIWRVINDQVLTVTQVAVGSAKASIRKPTSIAKIEHLHRLLTNHSSKIW